MRFQFLAMGAKRLRSMVVKHIAFIAKYNFFWVFVGSIVLTTTVVSPIYAQLPALPNLQLPPLHQPSDDSDTTVATTWIRLDGRRLFQIAAPRANLSDRVDDIQQRLQKISQDYFQSDSIDIQVQIRPENNLPVIYVNNQPLLTVTDLDAKIHQAEDPQKLAQTLSESLQEDFKRAKLERQPPFLARQGSIAAGVFLSVVLSSWLVRRLWLRSKQHPIPVTPTSDPVTTQLTQKQQQNLQEVRRRLFQLTQSLVWSSGTLVILGLFPYTRIIQAWILAALKIPFTLGIVGLGTYVIIRLSYVLIDRFTAALAINALLTPEDSLRLQLRVSTISGVIKGIATVSGSTLR